MELITLNPKPTGARIEVNQAELKIIVRAMEKLYPSAIMTRELKELLEKIW